ncbi:MAG: helix-turn-helix domain-containing protein, partial [Chloroflexota bacterium]|nr:helix-turn-helix domain-containing protein [Chloroflexota bacterium]
SKGYVFPAVATIAKLRRTSERTIRRHILELIAVKLLTRIRRRNKASILYIEEISAAEEEKYFALIQPQQPAVPAPVQHTGKQEQVRTDKNVHSQPHGERTKMSVAYVKENETKENEINVNEDKKQTAKKQRNGMMPLADITVQFDIDRYRSAKRPEKKQTPDVTAKRDYYAQTMAQELNDTKSLGAFRVIAETVPESVVFQALASVKETARDGKIRRSRGALFLSIIQQWCAAHGKDLGFHTSASFSQSALLKTSRASALTKHAES